MGKKRILLALFLGFSLSTIVTALRFWVAELPSRNGLAYADGNPVGGDFLAFYNAGLVMKESPSNLYDLQFQWENQKKLFRDYPVIAASPLPFVYPPLTALAYKYVSKFEFVEAFKLASAFGLIVYTIALWILASACGQSIPEKLISVILGLGFAPFLNLSLVSGHLSYLGILSFSLFYWLIKKEKLFYAGLILSLSYYKPPLFLVFILFLLLKKDWPILKGFFYGAIILTTLSFGVLGWQPMLDYLTQLTNYRFGVELNPGLIFVPKQGAGLLAAITSILPGQYSLSRWIFLATATLIIGLVSPTIKPLFLDLRDRNLPLKFSLMITLSLFLSLQMVDYDLSYLVIPITLIGSWLWRKHWQEEDLWKFLTLLLIYVGWSFKNPLLDRFECLYSASLITILMLLTAFLLRRTTRVPELESRN